MSAVRRTIEGVVAIVTLDAPPVNALGAMLRRELADVFRGAIDDPSVKAIVLIGSDRVFSGGGDINEFDGPISQPDLPAVVGLVESSPKLVVAAIGGICFGGGLELAMAAHYRIAIATSTLALPETRLGLIPGAGGTQRLPRAVGLDKALDLILSGETFLASDFLGSPLVDSLAESDLLAEAVAYAGRLVAEMAPLRRLRDREVESAGPPLGLLESARQRGVALSDRYPAGLAAIDCLELALTVPIDEAQRIERERFLALRNTATARALRYAFMAERNAAKIPDLPETASTRPVREIGIVGAGTMGRGICIAFLNAGFPVTLLDADETALRRAIPAIHSIYESAVGKGRLTEEVLKERMSRLETTVAFGDLGRADLVVEAVFEDIAAKETVFRRLDQVCKAGAILATNTSTLDVDRIASFTGRPDDVIGMHFFSPANVMKMLEVVRGARTSDAVLATAMRLARTIGKIAVVAGVCDGFIGNRMLEHYVRMAHLMVEEGALPWQVDRALEDWGMSMGPFRMGDLAGNDIGWAIRKRRYKEKPLVRYARVADRLCEHGRFGQKTGAGWYSYRAGSRTPEVSPEVETIVTGYRAANGIVPRAIGTEEIVERCIYALINEGARIVEEGVAFRASDVDVVYLNGYGFPRFRGGPMKYADQVGLKDVVAAMTKFRESSADAFWEPAALLLRAADEGNFLTGGLARPVAAHGRGI